MRALILAAGRGARLKHRTDERPKCLVELVNRPLLAWQIDALTAASVGPIALVTGYRSEALLSWGQRHFHNSRWAHTNMVASLLCAEEWIAESGAVIAYSDIVYRPEHIRKLVDSTAEIAIAYDGAWEALWRQRFSDPLVDAETFSLDKFGQLTDIGRRPSALEEVQGQYMGLLRFSTRGWAQVRAHLRTYTQDQIDRIDMTSLLRALLELGVTIHAIPVTGGWCEVDSERDLAVYERLLSSPVPWLHDWRWRRTNSE